MRQFLLPIMFLMTCHSSFSNQNWQYKGVKDGITMIAVGGYEDSIGTQRMYDAFLNLLVEKTRDTHRTFKILLLLDQPGIFYRSYYDWSATIAFDTLRQLDTEFIEAYNYHRMDGTHRSMLSSYNLPSNKYVFDLPEPLDINASFSSGPNEVGLKIIYDYGESDSLTFFDRIYTLVAYGINNIEEIKKTQKRITLSYEQNNFKVSLVTIDTSLIKSLPLIKTDFDYKIFENTGNKYFNNHTIRNSIIWSGVIIIIVLLYFYLRKILL